MVWPTADALAFRRANAGNRRPRRLRWRASTSTLARAKESRRVAAVSSPSPFGQNEWLVEEMYRKFREDPSSVDPSWHEFLVDYSPEPTTEAQTTEGNGQPAQATAPTAPPEPAPAPAPKKDAANGGAAPAKAPEPEKTAATPTPAATPKAPTAPKPAEGQEVQVLRGA